MADFLTGISAFVELSIELLILLVRGIWWGGAKVLGREIPKAPPADPLTPQQRVWLGSVALASVLAAGAYFGWYLICVKLPRDKTRATTVDLAEDWKQQLLRDGLPDFEWKTLAQQDAWGRHLVVSIDQNFLFTTVEVLSAGPDGQFSTLDEIATFRFMDTSRIPSRNMQPAVPDSWKGRLLNWSWQQASEYLTRPAETASADAGAPAGD